jgi:hypothetical protein
MLIFSLFWGYSCFMQITKIPNEENRYWSDRKPMRCPNCGEKAVKKSIFGYPSMEDFQNPNIHCVGCIPDLPWPRTWGCNSCDAAIWKDTPKMRDRYERFEP